MWYSTIFFSKTCSLRWNKERHAEAIEKVSFFWEGAARGDCTLSKQDMFFCIGVSFSKGVITYGNDMGKPAKKIRSQRDGRIIWLDLF